MTYIPYQSHSETSREAARAYADLATTALERVSRAFQMGPMTDEECQDLLDMNPSTQRPRRIALVQDGLMRDSKTQRPTRSGRSAVVWEVVPNA